MTVDRLTVREQLAIRYVGALIGQIDRSTALDEPAPDHIYDRIERLLAIDQDATDALEHHGSCG